MIKRDNDTNKIETEIEVLIKRYTGGDNSKDGVDSNNWQQRRPRRPRTRTTETKTTTELNKKYPSDRGRQQTDEYKTPDVVFYLLSVQFISKNQSIISII